MTSNSLNGNDLIVPIYIDTSALLDILASIEGGFSVVERVTTSAQNNDVSDKSIQGGLGLSNVLSGLLKLDLNATRSQRSEGQRGEQRETEKYHTYGSLVSKLRRLLDEENAIKRLSDDLERVMH
jgi:hypothetical protein